MDNINNYVPSVLNPRTVLKQGGFSLTQNSVASRRSLSLKRDSTFKIPVKVKPNEKENCLDKQQHIKVTQENTKKFNSAETQQIIDDDSVNFDFLENWNCSEHKETRKVFDRDKIVLDEDTVDYINSLPDINNENINDSYRNLSSATELKNCEFENKSDSISTVQYIVPVVNVSFGVNDAKTLDVSARNGALKRFSITQQNNYTSLDCELVGCSQLSTETETDENMNDISFSPQKRSAVTVNLEIKKKKLTHLDSTEDSNVLILNTNAIEKISHVIVQPPNYKFVKRKISPKSIFKKAKSIRNGNTNGAGLKQSTIDRHFRQGTNATINVLDKLGTVDNVASKEMSKNLGVIDAVKCDRSKSVRARRDSDVSKSPKRENSNESPQSARLPKREVKTCSSATPPPRSRNETMSAYTSDEKHQSHRKNGESLNFSFPVKSKSNKMSASPRNIPHHKIVAGTHFAVDAFSYGDIPNVKHYFLTHFHSDHYSGLKKTFSKTLFCSKITADLCITRLGVNPKNIRVINIDEVLRIEGVEVAAVDANHCPGALMLVFTLPNGKTLLHTGDFRACPQMESYPVFWNKDIHTVYLDTTYCNPRYDFPTQDQSLETALFILRQKKMTLEKAGKKFSSVLIVCGTYTIGKEKFFTGMARRVGCSVWACPEKERVLQAVEGRSFSREKPEASQLHVVPMRDLTHEKLRSYLDSLQGAFAEVVAFKPSGWENGKNSSVEKDLVTIHGIPYSEHSSFSELIRFIKFLKPKQVIPTVDISGGVKAVQKYFPCPLVYKDDLHCQSKVTDYFSIHNRQPVLAVT